ncbi:ATP-binding protein [Salipaludibacillus sp. LMS25]|jgi:signal transduction histidine kinase|uniref:ATP-binding protein n=1 Tax=Salipaludibacillus sp. LMS25 TaxID=2924031 RepID=UPI0020D1EC3A|nr:ATP-binding protein [Salipaludibacillus sp. LMS25]UTR14399.1 ATP-binding protein [Salipaludibacillus sp. LMS25]
MKKVNEVPQRELFQELIHLSSEFCIILDGELQVIDVITKEPRLSRLLYHPFHHLTPCKEVKSFIHAIANGTVIGLKRFSITVDGEDILFDCKGKKVDDNIYVLGNRVKESDTLRFFDLNKFPIPAMMLNKQGRILKSNTHLKNLHKQMVINENTSAYISTGENTHPIYSKYCVVFSQLSLTNRDAYAEYRTNDVRLVIKGLTDGDHILIMVKDESFQERYEELLSYQQQMQAVSQIAAGVAHELRNPLSVIKGFIQLSKLSNNLDKYYDTIYSEMDRMNKIIEDFLSISRKKMDKRYLQPGELVESMLMIFHSECTLHDVEFVHDIQETEAYLYVNDQMIKQVLINIMRNAIEAYEGQETNRMFYVSALIKHDYYVISLKDCGPGIPPHLLEKIDEPFFTTKNSGTGIGIPLGRQIIEEHNGLFEIASVCGEGTVVTIKLPIYTETARKPPGLN